MTWVTLKNHAFNVDELQEAFWPEEPDAEGDWDIELLFRDGHWRFIPYKTKEERDNAANLIFGECNL